MKDESAKLVIMYYKNVIPAKAGISIKKDSGSPLHFVRNDSNIIAAFYSKVERIALWRIEVSQIR